MYSIIHNVRVLFFRDVSKPSSAPQNLKCLPTVGELHIRGVTLWGQDRDMCKRTVSKYFGQFKRHRCCEDEHFSLHVPEVMFAQKYSSSFQRQKGKRGGTLKTGVHDYQNIGHNIYCRAILKCICPEMCVARGSGQILEIIFSSEGKHCERGALYEVLDRFAELAQCAQQLLKTLLLEIILATFKIRNDREEIAIEKRLCSHICRIQFICIRVHM